MATNGKLRAFLYKIAYPIKDPAGNANPDLGCGVWKGLIDFAVAPNGNYQASIPFEGLHAWHGTSLNLDSFLVYDGIGGYHGTGTQPAELYFRVTVVGYDSRGDAVSGYKIVPPAPPETKLKGTIRPHPLFPFPIWIPISSPQGNAGLWFEFMAGHVC